MDEKTNLADGTISKESDLRNINRTDNGTSSEDVLQMEPSISGALANKLDCDTATETFPYLDKVGVDLKAFANLDWKSGLSSDALGTEIPVWSDMRKEIPILAPFGKDPQSLRDPCQIMQDLGDPWENIPLLDSFAKSSPVLSSCNLKKDIISCQRYLSGQTNSEKSLNSDIPAQVSNAFQKFIPNDFGSGLGAIAEDIPGLGHFEEYFPFLDSDSIDNQALADLERKPEGREISSSGGCENIPDINNIGRDVPGLNELARNIPGLEGLNIEQIKSRIAEVDDAVESLTGISPTDLVSQIPGANLMGFGGNEDGDGSSSGDWNDFESVFSDLRSLGGDVAEIITDSKQFFTQLGALVGVFGTLVNTGSNVIDDYSNGKVAAGIFNIVLLVSVQIPTITAMLFVFLKDKIHVSWKGFTKVKEDLKELMEDLDSLMGSDDDEEENDFDFYEPGDTDTEFLQTSTDDNNKTSETPVEDDVLPAEIIHNDEMKQKKAEVQIPPKTDVDLSSLEEEDASIKNVPAFRLVSKKDNHNHKDPITAKQEESPQASLKRKSDDSTNTHADAADACKCSKKKKNFKKKRPGKKDEKKRVAQGNNTKGDNKMVLGVSESTKVSASSEKKSLKDESKLTSLVCSEGIQSIVSPNESASKPVFHNNLYKPLVSTKELDGCKETIPHANPPSRPVFSNEGFELELPNDRANSTSDVKDKFKPIFSNDRFKPGLTNDGFDSKPFISNDRFKPVSSDEEFKPLISLDELKFSIPHNGDKSQAVGLTPNDGFQTVVRRRRKKVMESQKHSAQNPVKTTSEQPKECCQKNRIFQQSRYGCSQHTTKPYSFHGSHTFQSYYDTCRPKEMSSTQTHTNIDPAALRGNLADGKDISFTFKQTKSHRKAEPSRECVGFCRQEPTREKSSKVVITGSVPHQLHKGKNADMYT